MADDDPPTFDITIPDCSADDTAALIGGLSLIVMQAGVAHRHGAEGAEHRAGQVSDVTDRLMRENREAIRHLFLESDVSQHIRLVDFPDELMDDLGIDVVDGQAVDAEDVTEIDIE